VKERNFPPIDLRQLHYFLAIAEHGSISAAAPALGVAQPSLSENISRLEECLDTQLIVRSPRGIQLTEAGVALVGHARELLRNATLAVEDVRHLGTNARGPASIGLPPSVGMLLSVPIAETLHAVHPQIRLYISEAMTGDMEEQVIAGKVELGCVYEKPEHSELTAKPVFVEDFFLVTAPDNWPAAPIGPNGQAEKAASLAEIARLPLVLPNRRHGTRELVEKAAKAAGLHLNVIAEIDSLQQIVIIVGRASAYSILTHSGLIGQVESGSLALVPIEPSIQRTVYLIRKRSRPISLASMLLEESIIPILRELLQRHRISARIVDGGIG
jgi:LysR family nitrogen assimilation transcriptional regulator